jgi:uncharacterized membrane protein YciS (DUF1049 family)
MYQKPTVPRSIGGVLDDTLQLYRATLSSCLLPAFLASLVTAVLSYFVVASVPLGATPAGLADLMGTYRSMFSTYGIWYLVVIAVTLVLYGMLIAIIAGASQGQIPSFGAALTQGARRAPALLGASILFIIAITIGFILLIIPGFYIWNRLQLYMVPLVSGPQGPGQSLSTSWRLVGGNWWRTAIVVFVIFVILLVLELVLGALAGILAVALGGGASLSGSPALLAARVSLISLLIGGVVRIFTTPLLFAALVAIYQDLLVRKGGGDLEARLGALPKG